MVIKGRIKKGEYFDSVTLMIVGKEVSASEGVVDAVVVMGTKENKSIIENSGLLCPEFYDSSDADLLISVKAESEEYIVKAFDRIDEKLKELRNKSDSGEEFTPKSLDGALKVLPDANMALISVAGKYAGAEAMKALKRGLHVMLFSDNISIEKERELKAYAKEHGLLVMGPDCGTAIINGAPLAFSNVVNRGDIGIVAASGTGLQELTSIISNEGSGVSQAIGTGGRDVKKDIGGLTFIQSLKALFQDDDTKVILLASKPPHADVLKKIEIELENTNKKIVTVFLGAARDALKGEGVYPAITFEEAALKAVALSNEENPSCVDESLVLRDKELERLAKDNFSKLGSERKYIRGLFSGGTFCSEAQLILDGKEVYSNAPVGKSIKLEDSLKSKKHTVVDLGEDEFTSGRPHPMIDFSLRVKRIYEEAKDPETAVILLDVVLGYGSNLDPAGELFDAIKEASEKVLIISSITGTDMDPQRRSKVEQTLLEAGSIVLQTNAAACKLAASVINALEVK